MVMDIQRFVSPTDDDRENSEYEYEGSQGDGHSFDEGNDFSPVVERRQKDFTEIKEQMYQDKLAQLKKQLQQLQEGTLPDYLKRLKRIEQQYKDRLKANDIWQGYCVENAEQRYQDELSNNGREFEQKKKDLKERLINNWEEKRRQVENDKIHMELAADPLEFKPISTRKLRRRQNVDGAVTQCPTQEKRRKQSPTLQLMLDETDILDDLKVINKVSGKNYNRRSTAQQSSSGTEQPAPDARIEDGKLYFEKRWYSKGQTIYVESKDTGKFGASISTITSHEVWVRKSTDNGKVRIQLSQIQKGKYVIRRRST